MSTEYRNNHYVPVWYQRRFLPAGQKQQELYYMDLKPGILTDPRGVVHQKPAVRRRPLGKCFVETDLYTTRFGEDESTKIEQQFFGEIDAKGRDAVGFFSNYTLRDMRDHFFHGITMYMSTQKLRTPKGLAWLAEQAGTQEHNKILRLMLSLRSLHCAIWTECIWQVADASQSATKFIISDHPVTVYNRRCGPHSQWCRDNDDPDIRLHGTHTIFPLSLDKILILTNLSWVRNPYQSPVEFRPNPNPFRGAMFNMMSVQTMRMLSEKEVQEINFVIKNRASRHIAAGKEEWLYPEIQVPISHWSEFGGGYLFMPDPRGVDFSREIIIGHKDGTATSFDEYGRKPWQPGYKDDSTSHNEFVTFHRFQGDFAKRYGPYRRGRAFNHLQLDPEKDSDDYHQYHLGLARKTWKERHKKHRKS